MYKARLNLPFKIYILLPIISNLLQIASGDWVLNQLKPGLAPEKTHVVNYTDLYIQRDPKMCFLTVNKKPTPGWLSNQPKVVPCSETSYRNSFLAISVPSNALAMCSFEPNWRPANIAGYKMLENVWYNPTGKDITAEMTKCHDQMHLLGAKNMNIFKYGGNIANSYCKRAIHYDMSIFGRDPEIVAIKSRLAKTLTRNNYSENQAQAFARFFVINVCVGINKEGCEFALKRLLVERDNSALNAFGFKITPRSSSLLFGDLMDIQFMHVWTILMDMGFTVSHENNMVIYYVDPSIKADTRISYQVPGLIG